MGRGEWEERGGGVGEDQGGATHGVEAASWTSGAEGGGVGVEGEVPKGEAGVAEFGCEHCFLSHCFVLVRCFFLFPAFLCTILFLADVHFGLAFWMCRGSRIGFLLLWPMASFLVSLDFGFSGHC